MRGMDDMTNIKKKIRHLFRERWIDDFESKWWQNVLIYIILIIISDVFQNSLRSSGIMYFLQMLLALNKGFGYLVNVMHLFIVFGLPWRPVRQFIWDKIFVKVHLLFNELIYGGGAKELYNKAQSKLNNYNDKKTEIQIDTLDDEPISKQSSNKKSKDHINKVGKLKLPAMSEPETDTIDVDSEVKDEPNKVQEGRYTVRVGANGKLETYDSDGNLID